MNDFFLILSASKKKVLVMPENPKIVSKTLYKHLRNFFSNLSMRKISKQVVNVAAINLSMSFKLRTK